MADSFVVTSTETLSPANIKTYVYNYLFDRWIAKVHFRFWTTHSPIKSRWFVRIAVVVAGVFMVATGLLSYQGSVTQSS